MIENMKMGIQNEAAGLALRLYNLEAEATQVKKRLKELSILSNGIDSAEKQFSQVPSGNDSPHNDGNPEIPE